jgi:hypothetical protein
MEGELAALARWGWRARGTRVAPGERLAADRPDRSPRAERPGEAAGAGDAGREPHAAPPERPRVVERAERAAPERRDRDAGPAGPVRAERPRRADRPARPARPQPPAPERDMAAAGTEVEAPPTTVPAAEERPTTRSARRRRGGDPPVPPVSPPPSATAPPVASGGPAPSETDEAEPSPNGDASAGPRRRRRGRRRGRGAAAGEGTGDVADAGGEASSGGLPAAGAPSVRVASPTPGAASAVVRARVSRRPATNVRATVGVHQAKGHRPAGVRLVVGAGAPAVRSSRVLHRAARHRMPSLPPCRRPIRPSSMPLSRLRSFRTLARPLVAAGLLGVAAGTSGPASAQPTLPAAALQTVSRSEPQARASVPWTSGERLEYEVRFGRLKVGSGFVEVRGVESVRGREAYHTVFQVRGGIIGTA